MSQHCKSIISAKPLHFSQTYTPAQVFEPFAKMSWSIWLDSSSKDHIDSQFDIIAWDPAATIITDCDQITVTGIKESATHFQGDPLSILASLQAHIFNEFNVEKSTLPFEGGALGYFAYDLGRSFERIPKQATKDIDIPEMAVGIYTKAIVYDNKSNNFYLVCPEEQRQALTNMLNAQTAQLHATNGKCDRNFTLTSSWQSNITKTQYEEKFNKIQHYLTEGDCYQINLTQRFSSHYQGNEFHAYLALRAENKAPFSAFLCLENFSILSVSPERFIQCHQGKVQTKPIKGTLPRLANTAEDQAQIKRLKTSEKDRAENLMIVDLLRNDMSKVCQAGSVVVPKLFDVESFPAVHHLVSTIEGKLIQDKTAIDLLRAAFPGGSITGAPKIRAMEIIDELEPQRRSIYCGSIGYISALGNMDTSITIRTLVCKNNEIYCWAGGGIVADSEVNAEYQESFDKVNKILPVLTSLK